MADLRCSFCGCTKGEEHSRRCGTVKNDFPESFIEWPTDIQGERDRYREALKRIADTPLEVRGADRPQAVARAALDEEGIS